MTKLRTQISIQMFGQDKALLQMDLQPQYSSSMRMEVYFSLTAKSRAVLQGQWPSLFLSCWSTRSNLSFTQNDRTERNWERVGEHHEECSGDCPVLLLLTRHRPKLPAAPRAAARKAVSTALSVAGCPSTSVGFAPTDVTNCGSNIFGKRKIPKSRSLHNTISQLFT